MDDGRLTREQERSMLDLLEQAALHDYPNPERKGCPGSDFLKRLATDRKSMNIEDPALTHVARCSPCYREFVSYRDAAKRKVLTRRAALAAGGAAVAGIAVASLKWPRSQNSGVYEHAEIDLFNDGGFRGTESKAQPSSPPVLPRKRLDLLIILPFASPEGHYEIEVLHANGKPAGVSSSGTAHLSNGETLLRVRLNLTSLQPAAYQISIRRLPYDWMPVPVEVK